LANVSEVEVFDDDGSTTTTGGESHQCRHRRLQSAVASTGGQASHFEWDRMRLTTRVAAAIECPAGQMVGVQINSNRPLLL
jgi:hypothetical protein